MKPCSLILRQMYINRLHFNEIDSTHAFAMGRLSDCSESEWTAISADTQTAGKGQGQKSWQDMPGQALLMTLVSPRWSLEASAVFPRHLAAAVAALRTLQPLSNDRLQLKWPNDLYRGTKKLGGILTEAQWSGENCKRVVFSIGVNALEAPAGFAALDGPLDLTALRNTLAEALAFSWMEPSLDAHQAFVQHWMHSGLGRWADEDGVDFLAQAVGIDDFGRIGLIRKDSEAVCWYLHGQVKWLGSD